MIIGVFSPVINWCGGAEWVAVNIITALKEDGHRIIVLSDNHLDQNKLMHVFNRKLPVDQQIILPLKFFSPTNTHNVYTDALRCLTLKTKCDVLIDTYTGAVLPGVDLLYVHRPLLSKVRRTAPKNRTNLFFYPYKTYLRYIRKKINEKLIIANSRYTANAIKTEIGISPYVLYPSIPNRILNRNMESFENSRKNRVITISRICPQKRLDMIPRIASRCGKEISFTIIGLLDSEETLKYILKLANHLKVSERVKIVTNASREQLRTTLLNSKVYLHTMANEDFGISIVEAMAAGCIPVVHNSGGPKEFVSANQRYNNVAEAALKVGKAINDWSPVKAKEFSKKAEGFGEDSFSKQFVNLFNFYFEKEID